MFGKLLFFIYLCICAYNIQAGLLVSYFINMEFLQLNIVCYLQPMFEVIQDESIIEKNELEEYMTMNSTLKDAGTLDASLDFYVTVLKDIPSDFHVKMSIERLNDAGEYIPQSIKIDKNYCEYIKTDKIIFPLMSKFGNFLSECPVKAGNYYMKNVTLKGYQLPLALPLGKYRAYFIYSLGEKEAIIVWKGRFVKV